MASAGTILRVSVGWGIGITPCPFLEVRAQAMGTRMQGLCMEPFTPLPLCEVEIGGQAEASQERDNALVGAPRWA